MCSNAIEELVTTRIGTGIYRPLLGPVTELFGVVNRKFEA